MTRRLAQAALYLLLAGVNAACASQPQQIVPDSRQVPATFTPAEANRLEFLARRLERGEVAR